MDKIASGSGISKIKVNAALLKDCICGMPRFDFSINCNMPVCNRAEPDIMIALAASFERTIIF